MKSKRILNLIILIFVISFSFNSCEKQDESNIETQENAFKYKFKEGVAEDFPEFAKTLEEIEKPKIELKSGNSKTNFRIDKSTIVEISDENNKHYTARVYSDIDCDNCFQNIVVNNPNTDKADAYVYTYHPDDEYLERREVYSDTYFTGNVSLDKVPIDELEEIHSIKKGGNCISIAITMCSYMYNHVAHNTCFQGDHLYTLWLPACSGGGGGDFIANVPGPDSNNAGLGDGFPGGGVTYPLTIPNPFDLTVDLSLNNAQAGWLNTRPLLASEIRNFLDKNGNTTENKNLAKSAVINLMSYNSNNYPGQDDGYPFEWWMDNNFLDTQDNFLQELWKEWKKLTAEEKGLTIIFPDKALKIRKNKEIAFTESRNIYGDVVEQLNGKPDAFRHTFFNAINTRDVGAEVTLLFSNAHESEVPVRWDLEKEMDLWNNIIGIGIGDESSSSNTQISSDVVQALTDGELKYLLPINYNDSNFWDNPNTPIQGDGTHGIMSNTTLISTAP